MLKSLLSLLFLAFSFVALGQKSEVLIVKIDAKNKAQRIDNFGAAGAWFSEGIGKHWPTQNRDQMAEWLFSKEIDKTGNPKGIGLSAWRFNIGGGTAEQGEDQRRDLVERRGVGDPTP